LKADATRWLIFLKSEPISLELLKGAILEMLF
jgi:hypothetical protein